MSEEIRESAASENNCDRMKSMENWMKELTLEESVAYLQEKAVIWDFPRLLSEISASDKPPGQRLVNKFLEYDGEDEEKTSRKIRNWVYGRNLPGNREELFKICFALELDEKKSGYILGTTAENTIHYRNPKELIYAYCLNNRIDYPQAVELVKKLWKEDLPSETLECKEYVRNTGRSEKRGVMTASIRNEFKRVKSESQLEQLLKERREDFGFHHNTAYRKFRKMLDFLVFPPNGADNLPEERDYSVERVVREYLRMGMPYDRNSGQNTRLQKEIKRHWPTEKTITGMCNRTVDVNRKTLLLLYVATEGMEEADEELAESAGEHYRKIDIMLADCGMAQLNIHSPFDYLVLQAVRRQNENDYMSLRLEWMIRKLFGDKAAYVDFPDRAKKKVCCEANKK